MDLNVLRKKPRMSSEKSAPTAGHKSTQPEVEAIHMETSAKRPFGSPVPDQVAVSRPSKWGHHYHKALLDRVHDLGRLVTHMGNRASLLEVELKKLKTKRDPE
ncbi:hypothetical protein B296_00027514 [Ensete ventricosum]|uniref:Uncharacterized protein n=1 Tax=Ensete ventricosum TaxID=4639 RepID=A0A426ZGW0_ENSVE|nr:hypothetical protein B296_00027514 [Ensete ventricosum]